MATITREDGRIESGDHVMLPLNGVQGGMRMYAVQGPGVSYERTFLGTPECARDVIEFIDDAFTAGYEGAQRNMRAALGLEE